MDLLFYFLVINISIFHTGKWLSLCILVSRGFGCRQKEETLVKSINRLQAPETLSFPLGSQHCPWRHLSPLTVGNNEIFWLQTERLLSMHPWHPAAENLFRAAHQLSTPGCNLLGAAKLLSNHLHVSCHWGKHWMAIGWAWIINPAVLWDSTVSVSQMGPLCPVTLLLCCLKYHSLRYPTILSGDGIVWHETRLVLTCQSILGT